MGILEEIAPEVEAGSGSWEFGFLPAADHFYPQEVTLYPLDFKVIFDSTSSRKALSETAVLRRQVPIVWAHHDDHRYMGKPYTPFDNFHVKLTDAGSAGFGIIHWLTRPLDLYFKSLSRQVWGNTLNESVEELNASISARLFPGGNELFTDYTNDWIRNAPMFGRETSDYLMDPGTFIIGEYPADPDTFLRGIRRRMQMLESLRSTEISPQANSIVEYYLGLEAFFESFIIQQNLLYESGKVWEEGRYEDARNLIAESEPEETLELFSALHRSRPLTKGEQAMIISMNLRWIPDFINQKQLVRLDPVRCNFQPTSHDPLAQAPGTYTFMVDETGHLWKGLGEAEIPGVTAVQTAEPASGPGDTYIASDAPFTIPLQTLRRSVLPAGKYRMILLTAGGSEGRIAAQVSESGRVILSQELDPSMSDLTLDFESTGGVLELRIDPTESVKLAGMEIIPVIK
jgi:hypothetical protein